VRVRLRLRFRRRTGATRRPRRPDERVGAPSTTSLRSCRSATVGRVMIQDAHELCAMRRDVLGHVGSKWSSLVLTLLAGEPRRYSEIRRSCRISPRMLSLTLRELERDGLIAHESSAHYALTPAGRSLSEIVRSLISWSDRHQGHCVFVRLLLELGLFGVTGLCRGGRGG
jgi:DNA-binding HxlR family transcriptional regulator